MAAYDGRMATPAVPRPPAPHRLAGLLGRIVLQVIRPWWRIGHFSALVLALMTTRDSYRPPRRAALSRAVVGAVVPVLPWFALLSTLVTVVIVRIVLVTAQSYGLSQYALEMVVRVLVLELIPLSAAAFVALRWSIPAASALARLHREGALAHAAGPGRRAPAPSAQPGVQALRRHVLPLALAGLVSVLLLALLSGVLALVLAYLLAHGLSPWGLASYTRVVGQVFSPAVTLVFAGKTLALALAVSLLPLGSALHEPQEAGIELAGLVRLASAVLAIEVLSLLINYA